VSRRIGAVAPLRLAPASRLILAAAIASLAACPDEGSGPALTVDVRTDFAPAVEFHAVRVELYAGVEATGSVERSADAAVLSTHDYFAGRRVADLEALAAGPKMLRVALLDSAGATLATRLVRLDIGARAAVTVVIARDCRAVSCPGAADPPEAITCAGGRCVAPECVTGMEPSCGSRECDADGECAVAVACARPRCVASVCLAEPLPGACPADQWCDPTAGCRPRTPPDAGMPDAGCRDAECNDGIECNGEETCIGGLCVSGPPVPCDDGIECTSDRCLATGCVHEPSDAACTAAAGGTCDPSNDCQYSVCNGATCFDRPCTTAVCEGADCLRTPRDGMSCDDGLFCNGTDTCRGRICEHSGFGCEPCVVCAEPGTCMGTAVDGAACPAGTCFGGRCFSCFPCIVADCSEGADPGCMIGSSCQLCVPE
jgi:hypothetical protein